MDTRPHTARRTPPSVLEAGVRVVESAQRLLLDRIDLVRLEIREDLKTLALALALLGGAGLLAAIGLATLLVAIVLYLARALDGDYALAVLIVAVANLIVAGGAAFVGVRRFNKLEPLPLGPSVPGLENGHASPGGAA